MSDVQLSNIKKSYGRVEVIPALDLTIRSGEFVVLVGPSGSGKSTLLRIIAGLESIDSGTISVDGLDITRRDPSDRDMAMVFQSYALYPHMTVAENMTFALRMRKTPEEEIAKRLERAIDILGLQDLEDRKPGQLSGGQRQRVAMGRAIVRQPGVFLFDEPLSNLDAKLRANTRLELRSLHERLEATSIFVTHDQIEAMTMADRIVLLDKGRIQQIGTPKQIYREPANRFVASFIGSPEINFMSGTVTLGDDGISFNDVVLPVSAARLARLEKRDLDGKTMELGIRPEHLTVVHAAGASALTLQIEAVEFTGQDVIAVGQAGGARVAIRMDMHAEAQLAERLQRGMEINIAPMEDNWHLFDPATGVCETALRDGE